MYLNKNIFLAPMDNISYILDRGYIRLVDMMGDDSSVVQAARCSTGKGTTDPKRDEELLRYLMRNEHTSPFEMVEMKWHAKMPIFVARQWIRHRTANVNEFSGRYSEFEKEYYVPSEETFKLQSQLNKQGGNRLVEESIYKKSSDEIIDISENAWITYQDMIEEGVSREQARIVLPVNYYTNWYWKNDLKNTLHFLKLRKDKHSQWEIREYADAMADIIKEKLPMSYKAFEDYALNGEKLSNLEMKIISNQLGENQLNKMIEQNNYEGMSKTESYEFKEKLKGMKSSI